MKPINMDKLKENAVRVEEVNGKIKLDKQNKADVEWYEEENIMCNDYENYLDDLSEEDRADELGREEEYGDDFMPNYDRRRD